MRCPKCGGYSFDSDDRCLNCGYTPPKAKPPACWGGPSWQRPPKPPATGKGSDETQSPPPEKEVGRTPGLERCPACREVSLSWNKQTNLFECLNLKCKRKFTESELRNPKPEAPHEKADRGVSQIVSPAGKERRHRVTKTTEAPSAGRAWFGNEYFDRKSKKWKKPTKRGQRIGRWLLALVGISLLVGSIAYFPSLATFLDNLGVKNSAFVRSLELPIEAFGAWLILLALFARRRARAVKVSVALLLLVVSTLFIWHTPPLKDKASDIINSWRQGVAVTSQTTTPPSTPTPTPKLTQTPAPAIGAAPTPVDKQTPLPSPTPKITPAPTPTRVPPTPTPKPRLTNSPAIAQPTPLPNLTPTVGNPPRPGPLSIVEGMNFEAIDSHALSTPESVASSTESLVSYLTQPARNDVERARAIFTWIAANISYDVQGYLTGNYGNLSPSAVLTKRTAVCEGYSSLFEQLGKAAGLQVVTIDGWAKGLGYKVGEPVVGPTNHAWNAVKIGNGWYLVDSTWAAGSVNKRMQFVKEFRDYYFFAPPEQFIYRHLPENPDWQLLNPPVSKAYFESLPYIEPTFFTSGLQLSSHRGCVINTGPEVSVIIGAPSDVMLSATLDRDGNRLQDSLIFVQRRDDNRYQIDAVFPTSGDYLLWIYVKNKANTSQFLNAAIEYKVVATEGTSGSLGFPETYSKFQEHDAYLTTPMSGHLSYGSTYTFKLRVPDALDVAIIAGEQWYHLVNYSQTFEGSYNVTTRGELGVYAKFPDSGLNYEGLLSYTCE